MGAKRGARGPPSDWLSGGPRHVWEIDDNWCFEACKGALGALRSANRETRPGQLQSRQQALRLRNQFFGALSAPLGFLLRSPRFLSSTAYVLVQVALHYSRVERQACDVLTPSSAKCQIIGPKLVCKGEVSFSGP